VTRTVADILDQAAVLVGQPGMWQQDGFRGVSGSCCAAGGIAQVIAPDDPHGDPWDLSGGRERAELGREAAAFFAEFLRDYEDAVAFWHPSGDDEDGGELDVIETIAGWNDDPRRRQSEVVSALRDAAAEWRERTEARAQRQLAGAR